MRKSKENKRMLAMILSACLLTAMVTATGAVPVRALEDNNTSPADNFGGMTAADYRDFGLITEDPEAFSSNENPLENYEPTVFSQLYVGYMNKEATEAHRGFYAVYDVMDVLSENAATIYDPGNLRNTRNGTLQNDPVTPVTAYNDISDSSLAKTGTPRQALNAIAVRTGNPGEADLIAESLIFTAPARDSSLIQSWIMIRLKARESGIYQDVSQLILPISDNSNGSKADVFKSLDTQSRMSLTALAAGDFDGDGKPEIAAYIPSISYSTAPYVAILDVDGQALSDSGKTIPLSELNMDGTAQYDYGFGDSCNVPVVNLTTTTLAGRDDLAVSVCLPRGDFNKSGMLPQEPALGIYSWQGDGPRQVFLDHLTYSGGYMRFPSTVQADVNDSGQKELVVAGYADTWKDGSDSLPTLSQYYANMVIYEDGYYRILFREPLILEPGQTDSLTASASFAMSPPVPLAAAKLSDVHRCDYLFIGSCVASFQPADNPRTDVGEFGLLEKGSLNRLYDMNISGGCVSQALSGSFARDRQNSQQIAVVWEKRSGPAVESNIAWLWMENDVITQHDTNPQYIHGRDADKCGTFLTLCRVNGTASQIRYVGKTCGWSKPIPMMVMPAVPYWSEISDPGLVKFNVRNSRESGTDISISMGVTGGLSLMGGAALEGNSIQNGTGLDFERMLSLAARLQEKYSTENSTAVSAPGDVHRLVVCSTPVVNYEYEYWMPAFIVDQAYIDRYKSLSGGDCPLQPGETVEAHWESYYQAVPCSSIFSMMSLDSYLAAWSMHSDAGNSTFDTSTLDVYGIGDPSRYPGNFEEIPYFSNLSAQLLSQPLTVGADGNDCTFSFDADESLNVNLSAGLTYSETVLTAGAFAVEQNGSADGSGQFELKTGSGGSLDVSFGASVGAGVTGSVKSLSQDAGDYSYQTTMGIWPCAGSGALLTTGYTVEPPAGLPPLPPQHPYVLGVSDDGALLCWDEPGEFRRAESFDVYYRKTGDQEYRQYTTVDANEKNHLLISGLNADTSYDFAFTAHAGTLTSLMSRPLTFKTSSGEFSLKHPESVSVPQGDTATFTVEVQPYGIGRDSTHTFAYQWEKLDPATRVWEQLDGVTDSSYQISSVTRDMDGTMVRAVVTSYSNGLGFPVPDAVAYSLPAALYINDNLDADVYDLLTTVAAVDDTKPVGCFNGVYYSAENQQVTISGHVEDGSGLSIPGPGTYTLYGRSGDGAFEKITELSVEDAVFQSDITLPAGVNTYYLHYRSENGDADVFSAPIVINAGMLKNNYWQVHYELDSGVNDPVNPQFVGKNSASRELAAPTRDHFDFEGWYADPAFTQKTEYLTPLEMTDDITLYAKWTPNKYGIYYYLNFGYNHPENPFNYTIFDTVQLKDPSRMGYRFLGWCTTSYWTEDSRITEISGAPGPGKNSISLYGHWDLIHYPIQYENTRSADTSKLPTTYSVVVQITPPPLEDQPQLTFAGWYDDEGQEVTTISSRTGSLTLTAKWTQKNYLLAYNANGGTPVTPRLIAPDTTTDLSDTPPRKTGYLFGGWYEDRELNTLATPVDNYLIDSNRLLHAKWDQNPAAHTVTFDSREGDDVNAVLADPGKPVDEPVRPTRTGYTFTGWYQEEACENQWDFQDNVTRDMTLYAGWEKTVLTVSFDTGGPETIDPVTVNWGETIDRPQISRENQKVTGWYQDSEFLEPWDFTTPVYEDITLYAEWEIRDPFGATPDDNAIAGIIDGQAFFQGDKISFSAAGSGMNISGPVEDDERYVPSQWTVNPSGTWSQPPYEATLDTAGMALGTHTLEVTFLLQRYQDGVWQNVGDGTDDTKTVTFTLKERSGTNGQSGLESPYTGDATIPLLIPASLMMTAAGALWLLLRRRRQLR